MRVLVTRPQHQADNLIHSLEEAGHTAVPLPLLAIKQLSLDHPHYPLLKQSILDLDLYQHVIFVSANAARFAIEWIDLYWPQLPIAINWYAIGAKTAACLNDYGIAAYHSDIGYDSEALLTAPELQQISGEKVLIFRGCGGREKLAEELTARGAQVSYAELYQRTLPDYSDMELNEKLAHSALDRILITSSEALNNLISLSGMIKTMGYQTRLLQTPLIVASRRIASEAENLGFTRITVAAGPDDSSMINAL